MSNITHATIIPLIGGEAIASTNVFGSRPDYILTYDAFKNNESHLLNYWNNEVPYYVLDKGDRHPHTVDVVSSVCPCAGLSLFSTGFGDDNPNNQWMIKSAEYVLGEVKPRVFWGENAPGLAGKIGDTVRKQLIEIGLKHGYSMTLYRTKSLLHGVPQVRERTFYFFWQGKQVPMLNYYFRPYTRIEDIILGVKSNSQMQPINNKKPTDDPYYRYLLEVIHGGITHRQHFDILDTEKIATRYLDAKSMIEHHGHTYKQVGEWMGKQGFMKEVEKCDRMFNKLADGGNIMRRGTIVPKDHIGAFVGHYPMMLTHPHEDRYITYREALTIMGMPADYELLNPSKSYNHICQNVPVQTATDMATEVKEYLEGKRSMVDARLMFQYNHDKTHEIMSDENSSLEAFF
jgi:site-specific DNA-cytosine methylase